MNKKIMFKTLFLAAFGMQLHAQDYCEPEWSGWAVNEPTRPVTLVQFGQNGVNGIDNSSSDIVSSDTPRYEDFSAISMNVVKGESYTLKVKGNTDGNNTDYITVYFDWNGDGVFSNSTPATIEEQQQWTNQKEKHQHGMSLINSTGEDDVEVSYTVNIPTDAVTGEIRMRVVKNYNAPSPAPCSNPFIFGQVEDYTLNISEGTCYPVFEYNADGEMITQVIFNTIDNTSPFQSGTTPQYEDFTDISTEVQAGSDYELSVKGPASTFPSDVVAYIDFNQDGVFDQDTEFFYVGMLATANPANANTVTTTITIPETALNGETIMRIIKNSNVAAYSDDEAPNTIVDACAEDLRSGQVEEYTINILEATESEYCIPNFFYPSSSAGVILNQISLTGETITWNIDAITYDENGYADYTDEPSADLLPGSAYDLNFHTDWQDPHFINVRAWVDYNQNGQFDDEEEIGYINSGMASSGEGAFNFTVPENTPVGIYRLRVIMQFPNTTPNNLTPCGTIDSYGVGIDYDVQVTNGGSTPGQGYCDVTVDYDVEPITLVDFSDLNNPTSAAVNGTPAYEDFTSIIANVEQGETYTLTVKGNTNGDFEHDIRVFIDWNNDTEFDMSTEYYTASLLPSTGEDNVEVSIEIVVPTDAVLGETRMRVTKDMWNVYEEGDFDACTNAYYGQIEDYTINISEPIEECTPITDLYEDFDDYSCCEMGVVPTCWDSIILGGASQIISSTEPASGTSQIYQFGFGEDKISIVVLPQFSNVNAGTHQFRFKVKASSGPGELEFGYITDIADASTFVVIEELIISNSSYDSVDAERIIAVPTSVPSTARLAVRNPGTTWAGMYWDDVYWEPISQNSIESVEVTTQDNIPAEITTENGTLQLVATVTPSDVSQAVTWSVEEGTEFVSVDENGLVTAIANGTATVRATSVEDETKYGEIEVVVNISEEPVDPDCEVIETFDVTFDDFENFPENCWSSNDSSEYTFTVLEEDSNKMLQVYSGFAEEEVYIISPEMVSIDGLHSVSYEVISISEPGTTLQIGTMSDPSNVNTFVAAEDAVDTAVGVYTSQVVPAVEGHKYVAIKYVHNGGHKLLKLDNIKWIVPASTGKFDRNQVKLYPNPTRDLIYVDTDLNLRTIEVYNNLGQRILTTNGADNSVYLSTQPTGVYIFRLQTVDGQNAEYKVIKQ